MYTNLSSFDTSQIIPTKMYTAKFYSLEAGGV